MQRWKFCIYEHILMKEKKTEREEIEIVYKNMKINFYILQSALSIWVLRPLQKQIEIKKKKIVYIKKNVKLSYKKKEKS